VTRANESWRTHIKESCHTHVIESSHTHFNESCHIGMNESCHVMNESCHVSPFDDDKIRETFEFFFFGRPASSGRKRWEEMGNWYHGY